MRRYWYRLARYGPARMVFTAGWIVSLDGLGGGVVIHATPQKTGQPQSLHPSARKSSEKVNVEHSRTALLKALKKKS
jgi:hypothetical protein